MVDQGLKHGTDFITFTEQVRNVRGIERMHLCGDFNLGGHFSQRAFGDEKILHGLLVGLACVAFRNVAANTYRRATKLITQTEVLA